MIMERPNSILNFLHLLRSSPIEIPGVSSMISFELPILPAPSIRFSQSASCRLPVRSFWASTLDSRANRRLTSCSFDISSENMAAHKCSWMVMCWAKLRTKAVLPIEGRAAIRIRSEGCKPAVCLSKSMKPVGIPVTTPRCFDACSIFAMAFITTCLIGT